MNPLTLTLLLQRYIPYKTSRNNTPSYSSGVVYTYSYGTYSANYTLKTS